MGLFIGISLLSVFEIGEFWIDFLSKIIMTKKKKPENEVAESEK